MVNHADARRSEPRTQTLLARAALVCAAGSAVTILFSIAPRRFCWGRDRGAAGLAHPVAAPRSGCRWRLPCRDADLDRILGVSPRGFPQVKKIYVYLTLVVVYSAIRQLWQARVLVLAWAATASVAARWGSSSFCARLTKRMTPASRYTSIT